MEKPADRPWRRGPPLAMNGEIVKTVVEMAPGLREVVMTLIVNSVDALPGGGQQPVNLERLSEAIDHAHPRHQPHRPPACSD